MLLRPWIDDGTYDNDKVTVTEIDIWKFGAAQYCIITPRPVQNGWHFVDDILKYN